NQGVTVPTQAHGTAEGRAVLRRRAHELRRFCTDLRNQGFRLDDDIDLRVGSGLGQNYEASTVAYKLYERGQVPEDAELKADLAALTQAYRSFLNGEISVTDTSEDDGPNMAMTDFTLSEGVESVINFVAGKGFIFEPWH